MSADRSKVRNGERALYAEIFIRSLPWLGFLISTFAPVGSHSLISSSSVLRRPVSSSSYDSSRRLRACCPENAICRVPSNSPSEVNFALVVRRVTAASGKRPGMGANSPPPARAPALARPFQTRAEGRRDRNEWPDRYHKGRVYRLGPDGGNIHVIIQARRPNNMLIEVDVAQAFEQF